ncbi:GPI-anchored CFEM domain protein [Neolecta irregularis DAH-3]|uniref:GPI-anchored CFEM domain protein n=1 Tax=Neolecta irregularis (strain DAH-3) TaxID=1198029 RepID=A0A1U7LMV2_NEOID|nr:GPI-anchored CFEM domain protein [Neolecta irregularis DAH-3]|eukprot:OLL23958.1 GPI-anchored CFEM domain protein [Neolecta irregularis DAH-3]
MLLSRPLVLALAALTAAQSIGDLPACAQLCLANGISGSGCTAANIKCVCASTAFLEGLASCVRERCSPADRVVVANFATTLCSGAGVTIPADIVSSVTAAAATAAATDATLGTANHTTTAPPAASTTKNAAPASNNAWTALLGIAFVGLAL